MRLTSTPTTVTVQAPIVGVPDYINNLVPGTAVQLATRLSDAFVPFDGEAGDPISVYFYSGGIYDAQRSRFLRNGGGHNNHNGNGIFGVSPYGSETPTWAVVKPHTSPPSVTNFKTPSVETAPNGDPASTHTYNQIVYDAHNDKLILLGLGSAAGSTGVSFARIRAFNLTSNTWDPLAAHPSKTATNAGGMACYDPTAKVVWGKDGGNLPLQRFDVVANTVTAIDDGLPTFNIDVAVALDPDRRFMIAIGGYGGLGPLDNGSADMVLWDLSSGAVPGYARTLGGFPAALHKEKMGLELHPPSGSFVAWAGGSELYRLIPPADPFTGAWTFDVVTPGGDGIPTGELGVYSGFRWAPYPGDPSGGVFVMDCVEGPESSASASRLTVYKPNF